MPSLHNPHAQPNRCFYLYIFLASCMLVFPAHLSPRPRPSIVPACLLVDPGSPAPLSLAQQVRCSSVLPISCSKIHLSASSFLPKELNTHEEAYQQRILNGQPSNHRSTRYTTSSNFTTFVLQLHVTMKNTTNLWRMIWLLLSSTFCSIS